MQEISLETMDGYEFQKFVANLFKELGFKNIELGPPTADGGIDISLEQMTDIGTVKYTVECKHHPGSSIGRPVVQKLHSAVMHRPVLDKGIIVTTGRFSGPAVKCAEEVGIELIGIEKLKELAKKAGLSLEAKPSLSVENCFPISDKDEIVDKLFGFLQSDLIGFNQEPVVIGSDKELVQIESIGIELISSYLVDYSINATFSTSIGIIHSINDQSSIFLTGESGEPINTIMTSPLLSQRPDISKLTEETLEDVKIIRKGKFTKSYKQIKKIAADVLRRTYAKRVSYYGANNVRYTKTCTPRKKDINLTDIERAYIPVWNLGFSLQENKYLILGIDAQHELSVLPSDLATIPENSGVNIYPDYCMICSRELKNVKYVCNECGIITCNNESNTCKVCGKVICREHTISKRKFLVLSDKYCPECAKSEGIA